MIKYLFEPLGMLDIESLSMSLYVSLDSSKVRLVQLTGTMTVKARHAIGTKILSLFSGKREKKDKGKK